MIHTKEDEDFNEEDYKKMFEFRLKAKDLSRQESFSSSDNEDAIGEDGM